MSNLIDKPLKTVLSPDDMILTKPGKQFLFTRFTRVISFFQRLRAARWRTYDRQTDDQSILTTKENERQRFSQAGKRGKSGPNFNTHRPLAIFFRYAVDMQMKLKEIPARSKVDEFRIQNKGTHIKNHAYHKSTLPQILFFLKNITAMRCKKHSAGYLTKQQHRGKKSPKPHRYNNSTQHGSHLYKVKSPAIYSAKP